MKTNIIPDWKLERYLLGELPAEEIESIRAIENADGGVRKRAEALRADNAAILDRCPPEAIGRKFENAPAAGKEGASKQRAAVRRHQPQSVRAGVPMWAVPAAVCLAALLIVPIRLMPPAARPDPAAQTQSGAEGDRIKGMTPGIEVWRKNGAAAERLPQEALARSGDVVQLRYNVPEFCYGALVSVDGRGVLTVHLSGDSGKAAPLTPGRPIALGSSYQLDDAPLFETFYLVTAKDIFDVENVTKSLKTASHPVDKMEKQILPNDQLITAFTLRKM